jgi:hypothetical protein
MRDWIHSLLPHLAKYGSGDHFLLFFLKKEI